MNIFKKYEGRSDGSIYIVDKKDNYFFIRKYIKNGAEFCKVLIREYESWNKFESFCKLIKANTQIVGNSLNELID